MTRFSIFAAALTGLALSSGASAAPKEAPATASSSSDEQASSTAKERQYCIVDRVTGSRIPVKVCKTRKEWMKESGFDPLNP